MSEHVRLLYVDPHRLRRKIFIAMWVRAGVGKTFASEVKPAPYA